MHQPLLIKYDEGALDHGLNATYLQYDVAKIFFDKIWASGEVQIAHVLLALLFNPLFYDAMLMLEESEINLPHGDHSCG